MRSGIKNRFLWADLTRICAISMVVLIHTFSLTSESESSNFLSRILFLISKMGVPLFLMLSGALLLSKQESMKLFFLKRAKRIIIPWFFWTAIITLLSLEISSISIFSLFRNFTSHLTASFNYIPMIMCLYLLIPTFRIIKKHSQTSHLWYLVFLWWMGVSFLPYIRNTLAFPLYVDNGLVRQVVQLGGYVILGSALLELKPTRTKVFSALAILIMTLGISMYLFTKNSELSHLMVSYTAPLMVIASAAAFWLLSLSESFLKLMSKKSRSALAIISEATFGIFLVHQVLLHSFAFFSQRHFENQLLSNFFSWIVLLVTSALIILVLQKNKTLRALVG